MVIKMAVECDNQFRQSIGDMWPRVQHDYEKSTRLINEFFDKNIIPKNREWDLCITVQRKGATVYNDQQIRNKVLKMCVI